MIRWINCWRSPCGATDLGPADLLNTVLRKHCQFATINLHHEARIRGSAMKRVFNHLMQIVLLGCLFISGVQTVTAAQVVRGPYLQIKPPTNVIVRWRTDAPTDSRALFGTSQTNLDRSVQMSGSRTNHELIVHDLSPYTAYFYSVGSSTGVLASGLDYRFVTAPMGSKPIRIW